MKKQLTKILSIVLSIAVVLSVCGILGVFSANASDTEKVTEYYVGYGGTGDGSSLEKMAPSVTKAIETINTNGLVAGDTATVYIVQDIAAIERKEKAHNLAQWGGNSNTSHVPVVKHTAKVVVKPHADNQKKNTAVTETYLALGTEYGSQFIMALGGPTEFQDVTIVYCSSSNFNNDKSIIVANGYDLTFNEGVKFGNFSVNGNTYSTYTPSVIYTQTIGGFGSVVADGVNDPFTNPINIKYFNRMPYGNNRINVPAYGAGTYTFNKDVTVEVSNPQNGGVYIALGTSVSTSTITYEKNLNFKINGYVRLSNNKNFSKSIVKGGLHLIVGSDFSYGDYPITNLTGACYNEDGTAAATTWQLNVVTSQMDYIDFSGETGKFAVAKGYKATATNKTTNATVDSKDGVLDLSAAPGEYTVAFTEQAEKVYDYYVKGGGTGNGTDINNPAPSVAVAVAKMNNLGLDSTETANIWIMQDVTTVKATKENTKNSPHNIAFWGDVPAHAATIRVAAHKDNVYDTADTENTLQKTYLAISETIGTQSLMDIMGPTEFDNVCITTTSSSNIQNSTGKTVISFNGNSVEFSKNTTFANFNANGNTVNYNAVPVEKSSLNTEIGKSETTAQYDKEISIKIGKIGNDSIFSIPARGCVGNVNSAKIATSNTFMENVTIAFDTGAGGGRVIMGDTANVGYEAIFKKNLNIKLTNIKEFAYRDATKGIIVEGGLHAIVADDVTYYDTDTTLDAFVYKDNTYTTKASYWEITVSKDDIDYVDFQGQTGKFTAQKAGYTAVAFKDGKLVKTADENGVMDLSAETGTYEIQFLKKVEYDFDEDFDFDKDDCAILQAELLNKGAFDAIYDINADKVVNICDLVALNEKLA